MQNQPSHNSLWFLMARSLSGECTAFEEEQLKQILSQDYSLQQQYDLMKRMWHISEKQQDDNTVKEEQQNICRILQLAKTEKISREDVSIIQIKNRKKYFYAITGVAAALVLIITAWLFSGKKLNEVVLTNAKTQSLIAENGSRTRTILPDGSTIWLNAGSYVTFNKDFSGKTREVTLNGEAYFDVVKQPERPFIVHVSGYDVKVLGTAFNVKSYATDKTVETTLIRGLVQVLKQGDTKRKPIFLHPNEKLIVDKLAAEKPANLPHDNTVAANILNDYKITQLASPIHEDERIETAWVYNRLEFRGDNFSDLAGKLERWYNVKIIFDDKLVERLNFTGSFETETVAQAFAALKAAQLFNYRIEGKEIHVRSANADR